MDFHVISILLVEFSRGVVGFVLHRHEVEALAFGHGNVDDAAGRRAVRVLFLIERFALLGHFDGEIQVGFVVFLAVGRGRRRNIRLFTRGQYKSFGLVQRLRNFG